MCVRRGPTFNRLRMAFTTASILSTWCDVRGRGWIGGALREFSEILRREPRKGPDGTSHAVAPELTRDAGRSAPADQRATQLFYEHARRVDSYVRHHHPTIDADDIVSETFVVAWRRYAEIEAGSEAAWLIGVARNLIRNASRSARRRHEFVEALVAARPTTSRELSDGGLLAEDIEPLRSGFAALSHDDQEILLLAAWEDLSGRDLATVLGTTAERATDRLYRARRRLRERIQLQVEES